MREHRPNAGEMASQVEDWTARLFQALGYSVEREVLVRGFHVDLVVRKEDLAHPVEVKYRRSSLLGMSDLVHASMQLRAVSETSDFVAPILVVLGGISAGARNWSQNQFGLRLWDLDTLREKARAFPSLSTELEALVAGVPTVERPNPADVSEGDRLIAALEAHLSENVLSPRAYEELCQEVFVHLFNPDLYGFQRQAATTDGANRYDFICRIKPGNAFWDSLRQDFRTRAILFECKNYGESITADQVYSTERYLFVGALRTVCFLISRVEPSDGALRAAQGAMRESGKLVLLLSNRDLIEMIRLRSQPAGPESYLDEKIWNFVISLAR